MADLSNNSFIPKRGPATRSRSTVSRQVYVFTIVSYVLMFATLLSVGGVYLYSKLLDQQLNDEIAKLNTAINSFSESDMQEVLEFDNRLQQASGRLNNSVSMVSVFGALEAATVNTVKIASLSLEREQDEKFILEANIETDSFDSTLFQRDIYQQNQAVDAVTFSDVNSVQAADGEEGQYLVPIISFTAEIEVPLAAVPYVVDQTEQRLIISPSLPEDTLENPTDEEVVVDPNQETL